MSRPKGSQKYGGRVKGTRNRSTQEVQAALLKLFSSNLKNLQADFKALKGKDRATLLIQLAKLTVPPPYSPEKLTDEQCKQVIKYFKENEN